MSTISLIGLPNSGKSSLFNFLTKSRQRVANFPGITVEKKIGHFDHDGKKFEVVDLPGVYTLDVATLDEKVTRDHIFGKLAINKEDTYTDKAAFILVMDATNLKRSIYLAKQLQEIGRNFIVALNMMDIATKRGQELDLDKLSETIGGAVVKPIVAVNGEGVAELLEELSKEESESLNSKDELNLPADYQLKIKQPAYIKQKLLETESILKEITITEIKKDTLTEKLDSVLLHPFFGPVVLMTVLVLIFQLLFAWSDPFMGMIEFGFESLGSYISSITSPGHIQSLLVDGIIAGVGGVLVFLPHIVFLFMIIYFLEDFGYLGRAAFLLDYLMRRFGLPGKAVIPLLSSHACAIPGIMSARIIENPFQRTLTMMVAPLTTCSARLPVYTLLIGVIVPDETYFGIFGLPGLVLFSLYFFGILSAFVVAAIAKKSFVPTSPSYLLMELPPYRTPKLFSILRNSAEKGWIFVKKAGTVILLLSIIIWGLVTFPQAPVGADKPAIHYSYAAKIGRTFEPIFRPLGFDWKITTALIPSFGAREVLVAAMGTVYAVDGDDTEDEGFLKSLSKKLNDHYSIATLLALLVWFIFSPQCIATFGVLKKETNGYKLPLIFGAYTLAMAYGFSWLTYIAFS